MTVPVWLTAEQTGKSGHCEADQGEGGWTPSPRLGNFKMFDRVTENRAFTGVVILF